MTRSQNLESTHPEQSQKAMFGIFLGSISLDPEP